MTERTRAAGVLTLTRNGDRPLSPATLLSVVVPCFNEEAVLPMLVERLQAAAADWGVAVEIVLVDDGSSDRTWELIASLRGKPGYVGVRLSRNFGHQAAVWAGLNRARGDAIAVIDADLQDPPEVVGDLLARWAGGDDVVFAVRRRRKEAWPKRLAYHAFYRLLAAVSETPVPLDSGDFCVMDRRVVRALLHSRERTPFIRGLRAWVGFRQSAVEYERDRRAGGEAKYTFAKLARLALDGLVSCSTRPLRLATWLGLAASLGGLAALAAAPWAAAAMLFLGGVQLLCLGILGEYVGRIFLNAQGRPQVIVSDVIEEAADRPKRPRRVRATSTIS